MMKGARNKSVEGNDQIIQKLFVSARIRITELNKIGVAHGRTDISEPEEKQYPILIDTDGIENWVEDAKSFAIDRRLKASWELPSRYQQIAFADILKDAMGNDQKGKKFRKVIILGAAGMGKSVLLRWLAASESQKGKLVLFPELRNFSQEEVILPSHALLSTVFSDQDKKEKEVSFQWMKENSNEVVIIIDSLDTMPFDLGERRPLVDRDQKTTIDVITHNLLSGNLLPGAVIVSSSREYKVKNMHRSVQPDRCIVIDGLSEKSVEELINGFLGYDKGFQVRELIKNQCPNIWPTLTIPVILLFTIIGFASDDMFIPRTMTAILINYFLSLIRSKHAHVAGEKDIVSILCKLMPMCLSGIRKGNVLFTPADLKLVGVQLADATDLGIFIPQSRGRELSSKLMQNERFFLYFSHQTQQECLAALYVVSLTKIEFEEFVRVELYEANFTVVRRLICGILFNAQVLESALSLTEIPDVYAKKSILLESLRTALHRAQHKYDAGDLLEIFIDLNEAKDGVTEFIRSCIRKIEFYDCPLKPSDVQTIASVMRKCEHLDEVHLFRCNLDEGKMAILLKTLLKSNVKIDYLNVSGNWEIGLKGILCLGKLVSHCVVRSLNVGTCDFKSEEFETFIKGAQGAKIYHFDISGTWNLGMEGMSSLGKIMKHFGVRSVCVDTCKLETKDMEVFRKASGGIKFCSLNLGKNDEIGPKGWLIVGELMEDQSQELDASQCHLSAEEVKNLDEGLGQSKLQKMSVNYDENIEPEGWKKLGELIENHGVKIFQARGSKLQYEKVKMLDDGMGNAKLRELDIKGNGFLGPEGWKRVGKLVERHEVEVLRADDCEFDTKNVHMLNDGMGSAKVNVLSLDGTLKLHYTPGLLDLIPRVQQELNLENWNMTGNEENELQEKLNEVRSLTLTIKIGSSRTEFKQLKASLVETAKEYLPARKISASERMMLLPARSVTAQNRVSSEAGGIVSAGGCSIKFPSGCLKKDHTIRISVENGAASDAPENTVPLSPTLGCDLSEVDLVPGFELEVSIRTYCFAPSEPVPIVLFCKVSGSDVWEKEHEMELGTNRMLTFKTSTFSRRYYALMRKIGFGWFLKFPVIPHLYYNKLGMFKSYLFVDDLSITDDLESKHDSAGFKSALVMPEHMLARLGDRIYVKLECVSPSTSNFGDKSQFDFLSDSLIDKAFVQWDFPLTNVPVQCDGGFIELNFTLEKGVPAEETQTRCCRIEWPFISEKDKTKNLNEAQEEMKLEQPKETTTVNYYGNVVNRTLAKNYVSSGAKMEYAETGGANVVAQIEDKFASITPFLRRDQPQASIHDEKTNPKEVEDDAESIETMAAISNVTMKQQKQKLDEFGEGTSKR